MVVIGFGLGYLLEMKHSEDEDPAAVEPDGNGPQARNFPIFKFQNEVKHVVKNSKSLVPPEYNEMNELIKWRLLPSTDMYSYSNQYSNLGIDFHSGGAWDSGDCRLDFSRWRAEGEEITVWSFWTLNLHLDSSVRCILFVFWFVVFTGVSGTH
jgi:hypothetical protein